LHQNALSIRKDEFIASLQNKADVKLVIQPPEKPRSKVPIQGQPWRGNPYAPIVLVHFSNFTCKLCDQSTQYILRATREFPGKIKWVHRNYFNRFDEKNLKLAKLGEWAYERNRFWEFHDAIFNGKNDTRARNMDEIVKQIGLDSDDFEKKEQNGHYLLNVRTDLNDARRIGVTSVPVMFVNGIYFNSTFPYEQLQTLIKRELAEKKNL
jgi:protein-disulfide isomerase